MHQLLIAQKVSAKISDSFVGTRERGRMGGMEKLIEKLGQEQGQIKDGMKSLKQGLKEEKEAR